MKKFTFPHPMVIMLGFVLLAMLLTYLIPAGKYDRQLDDATGREVVVQGSFRYIPNQPVGIAQTFLSVPVGIIAGAEVVVLILIIGGAFYVVDKTGAFQAGLEYLVFHFANGKAFLMALVGLLFAVAGALNGLQEEIIAMVPVLMILTQKVGFTKISGVAISLGCAIIGGAFGPSNPFSVLLAQQLAEVPVFSGGLFRLSGMGVALLVWIGYVLKTGKDPAFVPIQGQMKRPSMEIRHIINLLLVGMTFIIMIYGLSNWDWDYNEMSAIFFVMGLLVGIIGKLGLNGTSKAYAEGFSEMIFAGIIVGLARSIYLVLQDGLVIDTIIYGLFTPLEGLPLGVAAIGMFLAQAILHIPVPSTSGQAVLTMPLLSPLADLIGMGRQVVVLAYQYGAGIMDLVTPSNGGLMAILAAAGISYKEWITYAWKPILAIALIAAGSVLLGIVLF
mgnify:CR=1 FL=1